MPPRTSKRNAAKAALARTTSKSADVGDGSTAQPKLWIKEVDLVGDFVVIANTGTAAQDFTGWTLRNMAGAQYKFKKGYELGAGKSVIVWSGAKNKDKAAEEGNIFWGRQYRWDDVGDVATLHNKKGEPVCSKEAGTGSKEFLYGDEANEDNSQDEVEEEDEEEEEDAEEEAPKKRKRGGTAAAPKKRKAATKKEAPAKKKSKKAVKKATPSKSDPIKRPEIEELTKDPFFDNANAKFDKTDISYAPLHVLRAVQLGDHTLLKALIKDVAHVPSLKSPRTQIETDEDTSPLMLAIRKNDHVAMKLILDEEKGYHSRCAARRPTLGAQKTGHMSVHTLGFATGKIGAARGGKELNNALMDYGSQASYDSQTFNQALATKGVTVETIKFLEVLLDGDSPDLDHLDDCLEKGNHELAKYVMDGKLRDGGWGMSECHAAAVKQEPLDAKFTSRSITAKGFGVTPIHIASINPYEDGKIVSMMLEVDQYAVSKEDQNRRQPIHFASACEGTGPLSVLLESGANVSVVDKKKTTPLMFAARAARPNNIKMLMKNSSSIKPHRPFSFAKPVLALSKGATVGASPDAAIVLSSFLNDLVARVAHAMKAAIASADDKASTLRASLLAECENASDLLDLLQLGGTSAIAALPDMSSKALSNDVKAASEEALASLFGDIDKNSDNALDMDEIAQIFEKVKIQVTAPELEFIFETIDDDDNGTVSFEEFSTWMLSGASLAKQLRRAMAVLDGSMSRDEVFLAEKADEVNTAISAKEAWKELHMRLREQCARLPKLTADAVIKAMRTFDKKGSVSALVTALETALVGASPKTPETTVVAGDVAGDGATATDDSADAESDVVRTKSGKTFGPDLLTAVGKLLPEAVRAEFQSGIESKFGLKLSLSDNLSLVVRNQLGKKFKLEVARSAEVSALKTAIKLAKGPYVESQRLSLHGKTLEDGKSIVDYEIKDGDVVYLEQVLLSDGKPQIECFDLFAQLVDASMADALKDSDDLAFFNGAVTELVCELLAEAAESAQVQRKSKIAGAHVFSAVKIVASELFQQDSPVFQQTLIPLKDVSGKAALHHAAEANSTECVELLLNYGAAIDQPGPESKTALHVAAECGNVDVVKLLLERGCKVDKPDKRKRTALLLAIRSGRAIETSILLRHGANPDAADSSDNTCALYACAYGWNECIDLLRSASADFSATNAMKLSPLSAAMKKAHRGTMKKLLEECNLDVNKRDADGRTVLLDAVDSLNGADTLSEVHFLVNEKGAKPTITDAQGSSPLHALASADVVDGHECYKAHKSEPERLEKLRGYPRRTNLNRKDWFKIVPNVELSDAETLEIEKLAKLTQFAEQHGYMLKKGLVEEPKHSVTADEIKLVEGNLKAIADESATEIEKFVKRFEQQLDAKTLIEMMWSSVEVTRTHFRTTIDERRALRDLGWSVEDFQAGHNPDQKWSELTDAQRTAAKSLGCESESDWVTLECKVVTPAKADNKNGALYDGHVLKTTDDGMLTIKFVNVDADASSSRGKQVVEQHVSSVLLPSEANDYEAIWAEKPHLSVQVADLLLEAGALVDAKVEETGETPLILAIKSQKTDLALKLAAIADLTCVDARGNTPLMLVAESPKQQWKNGLVPFSVVLAKMLTRADADLINHAAKTTGKTALTAAVSAGNIEMAKVLLSKGADRTAICNGQNILQLHYAMIGSKTPFEPMALLEAAPANEIKELTSYITRVKPVAALAFMPRTKQTARKSYGGRKPYGSGSDSDSSSDDDDDDDCSDDDEDDNDDDEDEDADVDVEGVLAFFMYLPTPLLDVCGASALSRDSFKSAFLFASIFASSSSFSRLVKSAKGSTKTFVSIIRISFNGTSLSSVSVRSIANRVSMPPTSEPNTVCLLSK
eukprot:m.116384 g.116384  ORF g.116384 m.116384 type:complete len:1883 (+) comp28500_c0_seq1:122-5770(+)